MSSRVAIYVQRSYAKPTYAAESYASRAWPGMEMVRDAIERAGIPVEYCDIGGVGEYDVVLASITSPIDWYSFCGERSRWLSAKAVVVVGGPAVLNIAPVEWAADYFVFGRGEAVAVELIEAILGGREFSHESVVRKGSWDRCAVIAQADSVYPHEVRLANGKRWKEAAIGCQRKCLFCPYTWHRKHVGGGLQSDAGAGNSLWASSSEKTMFDYDLDDPQSWGWNGGSQIVGLDGFSERLRRMVNKPITRDMLRRFLVGVGQNSAYKVRLYNIVGLPSETDEDWFEFLDDVKWADGQFPESKNPAVHIELHNTPFKAHPATPAGVWAMSDKEYRGTICRKLRHESAYGKYSFFEGNQLRVSESFCTESLSATLLWSVMLRGSAKHSRLVRDISASRRFWRASSGDKVNAMESAGVFQLLRPMAWEEHPAGGLKTHCGYRHVSSPKGRTGKGGNKDATLDGDGRTFDEIEAERGQE